VLISILYITCRGVHPDGVNVDRGINQFTLLAESLASQAMPPGWSWDLVVVDRKNPLPRPELEGLGSRVTYHRPRKVPLLELGGFCAASARGTGLAAAAGEVVLGMDDFVTLPQGLLAKVAAHAERGEYLAPACVARGTKRVMNGKRRVLQECGGVVAYPTDVAMRLGAHETRFDGCEAFEDLEFSARMARVGGVVFVSDGLTKVVLHRHERRLERKFHRCGVLVRHLLRHSTVANEPWTSEQLEVMCRPCPFVSSGQCQLTKNSCRGPTTPGPAVVEIMRTYELTPGYAALTRAEPPTVSSST